MAHKPTTDVVYFEGRAYYRYPNSRHPTARDYYKRGNGRRGQKILHIEIWKATHGPVPEGCYIHHIDGNPLNNELDNLECLSASDHGKHHTADRLPAQLAWLAVGQRNSRQWHGTSLGRQWHSQQAKQGWATRKVVPVICLICQKSFETPFPTRAKYCSGKCQEAARPRRRHRLRSSS